MPDRKPRAPTLYFIIVVKLLKGLLLLGLALGVYTLAGKDLHAQFDSFLELMKFDPERKFFSTIDSWPDSVTPGNIRWVATGTLLYSLFSLIEGIGLIFRVSWAGWMAIGESAFFVPIEIYELVHRGATERPHSGHPVVLLIILALNIFIVWYLFANRHRLFRHHHHH